MLKILHVCENRMFGVPIMALRVRITGFTGYFTQFERSLQDELISRTECAGRGTF